MTAQFQDAAGGKHRDDPDAFGAGLFDPPPLTGPQRAAILRSLAAGHAPQKACLDAGVDPLAYISALHEDAAFSIALGRLEAVRSLNVLSVTYQKAIGGAAADRSLYLKFRPPPPAPELDAETVFSELPLPDLTEAQVAGLIDDLQKKGDR